MVSIPGTAGSNAFSVVSNGFVVPASFGSVSVKFASVDWLVVGQYVIMTGPFNFKVLAIDSDGLAVTLQWQNAPGDGATGTVVNAGTAVVPAGQPGGPPTSPLPVTEGGTGATSIVNAQTNLFNGSPLTVGNGGTGATTKAAAQIALGLGQDPLISTVTGLTQAVTASSTQVGGSDVTVPATGTWLVSGQICITITGATFAASRTVTVKIRNVTQGADVVSTTFQTGIITTATNADQIAFIPPIAYTGGSVNDHLQVFVSVSVINTAGTYAVASATLCAVPLRKS